MVRVRAPGFEPKGMAAAPTRLPYLALAATLLLVTVTLSVVMREGVRLSELVRGGGLAGISYSYSAFSATQGSDPVAALEGPFEPTELTRSRAPFAHHVQWHRLELLNTTGQPRRLVLLIDNPLIDLAHVYDIDVAGRPVLLQKLGEQAPQLDAQVRAIPHYEFSIAPGAERRLLVGHFTQSSPLFPLSLLSADGLSSFQLFSNQVWAAFLGISLLICLYNFMLYLAVRDRTYLVYIGYVVSLLLALGATSGYLHLLFPEAVSTWLSEQVVSLNAASMILAIQFAIYFLRLDEEGRMRFRLAQWFSVLVLMMAVASLFVPEYVSGPTFTILHCASYVLAVVLFAYRFRERLRWTRFYLISWFPFLVGVGLVSGMFQGVVPYGLGARFAGIAGVSLEMALMSMALADRLIRHERLRLYQATHDPILGLGSYDVMASALETAGEVQPGSRRAIVLMEVSNYHDLVPYLSELQFRFVMCGLARVFEQQLSPHLRVRRIDVDNPGQPYVVLCKSEIFSVVVEERERGGLDAALAELEGIKDFNPHPEDVPYRVHCRFGAAFFERPPVSTLATFNHALVALDLARQQSRSCWQFSPDDMESADRRIRLARDLDNAIRNDLLDLHYQPKLDLHQPGRHSVEALLRWKHPELGWIPPDEIVAVAENTGLIQPLTRWVLSRAVSVTSAIGGNGDTGTVEQWAVHVSVNVSTHDLSDTAFADYIEELDWRYPLLSRHLTLEVTESARLTDTNAFAANLARVRALGMRCAVDDFGTGYAALSYATAYPFDELKIDRSFTSRMGSEARFYTAIGATVAMASRLGMQVTAEGVETLEEAQALAGLGCQFLQGYWIARPMGWEEYLAWVEQRSEADCAREVLAAQNPA